MNQGSNPRERMGIYCFLFVFFIFSGATKADFVDFSQPGRFGNANLETGEFEYWIDLPSLVFKGARQPIPLRTFFNPNLEASNGSADQWGVPLLNSRIVKRTEDQLTVHLPCGKKMYLVQSQTDKNKYASTDKKWQCVKEGDSYKMERDDGWALWFSVNGIVKLRDDKGIAWTWVRNPKNVVSEIRCKGEKPIQFIYTDNGSLARIVWKYIDVRFLRQGDTYEGIRSNNQVYAFAKKDEGGDRTSFTVKLPGGEKEHFSYVTSTGLIKSDSKGTYHVTQRTGNRPSFERVTDAGKEQYDFDVSEGVETFTKGGRLHRRYFHTGNSILYMKPKYVAIFDPEERVVEDFSYDAKGRLLRHLAGEQETFYTYGDNGLDWKVVASGIVLKGETYKDGKLVEKTENGTTYRVEHISADCYLLSNDGARSKLRVCSGVPDAIVVNGKVMEMK